MVYLKKIKIYFPVRTYTSYNAVAPMSVQKHEQVALSNCTVAMGSGIPETPEKNFEPSTASVKTCSTHTFTDLLTLNQCEKKKKGKVGQSRYRPGVAQRVPGS
jgi:hypothetical protein